MRIELSAEEDEEECWRSGVTHQNPHLPPNCFAAVLDSLVLLGERYARRVGVCPTQVVALRAVPGPSGGALRDVPPNLYARAARDRDRQRLLPLPPVRSRSARVGRCPRAHVPEPHTAEATGADDVCQRLDDLQQLRSVSRPGVESGSGWTPTQRPCEYAPASSPPCIPRRLGDPVHVRVMVA